MQIDQQSYAEIFAASRAAVLDDLLSHWHRWQQLDSPAIGYVRTAAGCSQYRASRQYDDVNGSLDAELDNDTMEKVDFAATEMPDPYRSAIYAQAKCLSLGLAVFRSPRVPEGEAGQIILRGARQMLIARLISAGVM